jgi:hypothetical protein
MRHLTLVLALAMTIGIGASAARAQVQLFDNPKFEYTLELPSPTWRMISLPDADIQALEFINGPDRSEGLLRVRKEIVEAGVTPSEMAHRDQDQRLRFQPGYVDGKEEPFSGRLNGVLLSYEYTNGGKPMAGRIYYLKADNRVVYTLRFTGTRTRLGQLRNQTDLVARSFKLR